jgi:hypothetical protein
MTFSFSPPTEKVRHPKTLLRKEIVEVIFPTVTSSATCPIGGRKALLYPVTWGEGVFTLMPNGLPDNND